MTIQHQQLKSTSHDYWTKNAPYELFCDKCGKIGLSDAAFKDCVDFSRKNKWKSVSVKTNSYPRFLWAHYCRKCKTELRKNDTA